MSPSSRSRLRPRGIRTREALIAVIAAVCAVLLFHIRSPLRTFELQAQDYRYHWRGARRPDPRVVIVAIDSQTRSRFKKLFPGRIDEWPRHVHGQVVDHLTRAGAAVIGWDIFFSDTSEAPGEDSRFAAAMRRACPVVLPFFDAMIGAAASQGKLDSGEGDRTVSEVDSETQQWLLSHGKDLPAEPSDMPLNAYLFDLPTPVLRSAAADVAYIDTTADPDGVWRRVPLMRGDNVGRWRSSLGFALFSQYAVRCGSPGDKRRIQAVEAAPDALRSIDFPGPPGTIPRLSYDSVWDGSFDPSQVRGKIVLIGFTGPDDVRPNPFSPAANGIEIHAGAIDNLLRGRFLSHLSLPVEWLADFGLALIAGWLIVSFSTWRGLGAVMAIGALYLWLTQFCFSQSGTELPFLGPLVAMGLSSLGVLHYRLADEEIARRNVEAQWRSYVGPDVLEEILNNPAVGGGAGESVDATVVFSDIRGYSGLSEKLTPQEVIRQINEHFSEMTTIVFACGGTVLGVTGDGLLMVFGWPQKHANHADRAMTAARAIVEGLASVNARWEAEGRPTIDIGLGIHSGQIVAGRVGGEQGSQLTVIGDAVNVAARVQDLNKAMKTNILMTEETRKQVVSPMRIGKSELVDIRGREQGMLVYELLYRTVLRADDRLR